MTKKKTVLSLVSAFVLIALAAFSFSSIASSAHAQSAMKKHHRARFLSRPLHKLGSKYALATRQAAVSGSIPTWSSSFNYNGQDYPYTMVGTDPHQGSQTTTIPVDIVPLIFTFSDGTTLDGSTITDNVVNSPLFQNGDYVSGTTQYADAIQRAEFWSSVSATSPDYHVLLGQPTVQPAVTLNVPAASGSVTTDANGNTIGNVDINWFSGQADQLATAGNLSPSHLTIFAAVNVNQYQGDPSQCCIGGYHTAVQGNNGSTYTYAYSDYDQAGDTFQDIAAMSHEIAEWANDPFVNNTVPNWSVPSEPQYGCNSSLEVGDPEVGNTFTINGYHVQDEAFFSWFARENPSQGYNGQYDYMGNFTDVAPSC